MNSSESSNEIEIVSVRKRNRRVVESDSDSTPEVVDLTRDGKKLYDNRRSNQ